MVDNSRAKIHLDNVRSILSNVDKPNDISSIINKSSLDLLNNLSDNYLFVDNEVIEGLRSIENDLSGNFSTRVTNQITALDRERSTLITGGGGAGGGGGGGGGNPFSGRISEIGNLISSLNNINSNYGARHTEFQNLVTNASYFNLGSNISNQNIDVSGPTITGSNIDLSGFHTVGAAAPHYLLCDENGKEISNTGGNYKLQIGGTEHTLGGVNFAGDHLDLTHLSINPRITDLPQTLNLSITAYYPVTMGARTINVACNKKFKINLNNGTASVNTETARQREFDDCENNGGGHLISDRLNTIIDKRNTDPSIGKNVLERQAIEDALKCKGGTKYSTLSDEQKRLFYERVCRSFAGGAGLFSTVYVGGGKIDTGVQRYNNMKTWFTDGSRPWNNDQKIIGSASTYKTFILSNLEEKCTEYILSTLENYLQEDTRNTELKAELSKFLQEIDQNKLDDNNVNTGIYRELNHRRYKMKRGPRSPFRPRDVNYMRFLSGSSVSQKNQKVNIYSNIDRSEPVEYDMDLSVSGKNNIEVEIKIKGTNEIIKQKAAQPATLVRKIMREQRIEYGKVRAHIGFNIYKSIIQIAQGKDISLTYRGMQGKIRGNKRSQETRKITLDSRGNIVIKQIDHTTTLHNEKDVFVFDQNTFLNSNEFDNGQTNGRLREGLETLAYHFNVAMNHLHKQYRKSTKRRILKLLPSRNRLRLPTSFWLSPIKKILNTKTTTNFDFNTTINAGGKNIKIDYVKNKFTITTVVIDVETKKEKTITISSRDLGKLLNHREGKVRIFDGVERDIVGGVYSSLVDALRKNSKIARTNFGVVDDITGNMYVLDEDGKFGVIAKEDFKGRNKIANPFRGRFRKRKKSGALKKKRLDKVGWRELTSGEEKELLKNPLLMQKFVKAMNKRMGLRGSIAALFN